MAGEAHEKDKSHPLIFTNKILYSKTHSLLFSLHYYHNEVRQLQEVTVVDIDLSFEVAVFRLVSFNAKDKSPVNLLS